MSVVEELRQNDPANTCIRIGLHGESSDAALAQALEQNPFVTDIIILNVDKEQRADWDSLLRVIAMRGNLEKVELRGAEFQGRRNTSAGLVCSFLQAIQQNNSIRSIELQWLRLPIDISTYVDIASSITSFCIYGCVIDIEPTEWEQAARSLAAALQRNKNIQSLKIYMLDDTFTIPILESLRSNTSVRDFTFYSAGISYVSDAASDALHQLLDSSTSIERLDLEGARFVEETFRPVAQSLIRSQSVCELDFSSCVFEDCTAQFQSVLLNKQNLTSLCFDSCEFFAGEQIHGDITSILLRPGSLLLCFEFYCEELEQTIPVIQFKNLLRAIEQSKLERFQIGTIETPHYLQALTQSIPSMKLKELEICFSDNEGSDDEDEAEGEFDRETIRQDLLNAVKNNFSLRSLKAELSEIDLFDNDDKQTLAFYAKRNEILDQWVDKPEIVDQCKVWPDALNLAQKAGPNALFRGLRSVLESDYGSLPGESASVRSTTPPPESWNSHDGLSAADCFWQAAASVLYTFKDEEQQRGVSSTHLPTQSVTTKSDCYRS